MRHTQEQTQYSLRIYRQELARNAINKVEDKIDPSSPTAQTYDRALVAGLMEFMLGPQITEPGTEENLVAVALLHPSDNIIRSVEQQTKNLQPIRKGRINSAIGDIKASVSYVELAERRDMSKWIPENYQPLLDKLDNVIWPAYVNRRPDLTADVLEDIKDETTFEIALNYTNNSLRQSPRFKDILRNKLSLNIKESPNELRKIARRLAQMTLTVKLLKPKPTAKSEERQIDDLRNHPNYVPSGPDHIVIERLVKLHGTGPLENDDGRHPGNNV